MNPGRYFAPGYMGMRNIPMSNSMLRITNPAPRSLGLFSRITNGIRSVNWGGLLTSANKTLNVVNQAIPLVRQAGPMINNMKSILRIAKVFGNETTGSRRNNRSNINTNTNHINSNNSSHDNINNSNTVLKKEVQNDSVPNFFV